MAAEHLYPPCSTCGTRTGGGPERDCEHVCLTCEGTRRELDGSPCLSCGGTGQKQATKSEVTHA